MSARNRLFVATAQVRAADLEVGDFVRIPSASSRWRRADGVFRDADALRDGLSDRAIAEVDESAPLIPLDDLQGEGFGFVAYPTPRPDRNPVVLDGGRTMATLKEGDASHNEAVSAEVLVYALLSTGEYAAVRYLLGETSDGSRIDHGWAIFPWFEPVTIQVEVESDPS